MQASASLHPLVSGPLGRLVHAEATPWSGFFYGHLPGRHAVGWRGVGALNTRIASCWFCNLLQLKIIKVLNLTSMLLNFIHSIQHPSTGA
jgi:hypothetical protein